MKVYIIYAYVHMHVATYTKLLNKFVNSVVRVLQWLFTTTICIKSFTTYVSMHVSTFHAGMYLNLFHKLLIFFVLWVNPVTYICACVAI